MKKYISIVLVVLVLVGGYLVLNNQSTLDNETDLYTNEQVTEVDGESLLGEPATSQVNTGAKLNPRVVCEGALAYMTFTTGEEAEAFVEACVNGEHPEVMERYIQDNGFNEMSI